MGQGQDDDRSGVVHKPSAAVLALSAPYTRKETMASFLLCWLGWWADLPVLWRQVPGFWVDEAEDDKNQTDRWSADGLDLKTLAQLSSSLAVALMLTSSLDLDLALASGCGPVQNWCNSRLAGCGFSLLFFFFVWDFLTMSNKRGGPSFLNQAGARIHLVCCLFGV